MKMDEWGLSPFFEDAFRPHDGAGRIIGRVLRSQGRFADLMTEWDELPARVPPAVDELVVGDWVACDPVRGQVVARLPRRTRIARVRPGRAAREQVLAANVDVALVLTGLDDDFSVRRIERYLALAAAGAVDAVLVLTKADLCEEHGARRAEVERVAAGRPVLVVCVPRGEGVARVRAHVEAGRTAVLLGSSGVGKSTLLNALLGESRARIRDVADDGRGRHTTTHRELFRLPGGGLIADVPGIREVGVMGTDETVLRAFDDVAELATSCRFNDCGHEGEPGCAVQAALDAGHLAADRFAAFRALRREAVAYARRTNEHDRRRHEKAHPAVRLRIQRRREKDRDP